MRPTFDKLSHDAPTILNGTNEYEYVLVGTFHSVHNYHSCPPFPIQLFGWGSYPLEYLWDLFHHSQPAPCLQALLGERKVPPIEHTQKLVYSELRPATRARFDAFGQDALGLFQRVDDQFLIGHS